MTCQNNWNTKTQQTQMFSTRIVKSPVRSSPNMLAASPNMLAAMATIPFPAAVRTESLPIPIRTTPASTHHKNIENKKTIVRRACHTISSPAQQLEALLASETMPGLGQLYSDVCKAKLFAQQKNCASNLKFVAGVLASYGYSVKLRSGRDSRTSTDYLTKLKHTFLVISGGIGGYEGADVMVEIEFSGQFEVAKPTQRYAKFLGHVPEVLVATKETMEAVLQLTYSEMELCFDTQGLFMPPWRMLSSLISKWLPQRFNDVCVLEEILSESDGEDVVSPTSVLESATAMMHCKTGKNNMRDVFAA